MLSTNNTLANIKSKIDELVKDGMMVYNLYFEEQILYRIGFYKTDIYTYYFDTKLHEKKYILMILLILWISTHFINLIMNFVV